VQLASFFSGAGGLDKGFSLGGFSTVWANEFSRGIAQTFVANHPSVQLRTASIVEIDASEVPSVDGIIGGPPCQSWSAAGAKRGISDPRGQLFLRYIELIGQVKPKFFVAENVEGILHARNREALRRILDAFTERHYNVSYGVLNASDYGVAQDRKRVFFVGFRTDLGAHFNPPQRNPSRVLLRQALAGLNPAEAVPIKTRAELEKLTDLGNNHQYYAGDHFSPIFMSRNRVRGFDETSFTIQASASHAPIHPQAPKMIKIGKDSFAFVESHLEKYRRLSVRECARIQGFPDDYEFRYTSINTAYKMIGNAVPVPLAAAIARQIRQDLPVQVSEATISRFVRGTVVSF
jgi:DNA (cytosine-5)-methyltransferase 1